jgi:hypothetical protein
MLPAPGPAAVASCAAAGVLMAAKEEPAMSHVSPARPPADPHPNAELHAFEPLRIALALGALLLGLVVSIH